MAQTSRVPLLAPFAQQAPKSQGELILRLLVQVQAAEEKRRYAAWHAIAAGLTLQQLKKTVRHGEWIPLVQRKLNLPIRSVQLYMWMAKRWGQLEAFERQGIEVKSLRDAISDLDSPLGETKTRALKAGGHGSRPSSGSRGGSSGVEGSRVVALSKPEPTPNAVADLPGSALVSIDWIAKHLCIGRSTAYRMIKEEPSFPKAIKFGARCTRYRISELREFIERARGPVQ